jgi:hypothetical protein
MRTGVEAHAGCDQAGAELTLRMKGDLRYSYRPETAGSRISDDGELVTIILGETVWKAREMGFTANGISLMSGAAHGATVYC